MTDISQIVKQPTGWILEALQEQKLLLESILVALTATNWTCGCGHINGPNLATCAQCWRKPGDIS